MSRPEARVLMYQWVAPFSGQDWPPEPSIQIRCRYEPAHFRQPEYLGRSLHDAVRHLGVAIDKEIAQMLEDQ